ncbi:MAG: HEAT repeat domain-containing protein [Candidatus Omnitrophica bacterium]|nr:HEAT repeat domain-containing protein [Candidatus Omnitrophota bacterium]MBU1924353.1 HEAT repeat domain-containing protein [Candidatus Omnitrophota bacterium]
MIRQIVKRSVIFILIVCFGVGLFYLFSFAYWFMAAGHGPEYYHKLYERQNLLSSEKLIKKINSFDLFSPYPGVAIDILAERKEKEAVPSFIKIVESRNPRFKKQVIWALGQINDERAIKPLMFIVKQGQQNEYFIVALRALAYMKYEGALDFILDLAKKPDAYKNESVNMLEAFGDAKYIPILIGIRNKIDINDNFAKFNQSIIDDAIAHLKSLQQSESPQEVTK